MQKRSAPSVALPVPVRAPSRTVRGTLAVLAILLLAGCAAGPRQVESKVQSTSPALQVVQDQVDAFNRHDVEAMAAQVAPGFVWFSIRGDEMSAEVRGREALAEGMRSYFASLPTVRSQIEEVLVSGAFVTLRERAIWTDGSGQEQSQAALGVYEVRNGLIQRVWYYPVMGPR